MTSPAHQETSSAHDLVVIQRNPTSGAGRGQQALLQLIKLLQNTGLTVRMFSSRRALDMYVRPPDRADRLRCLVAAGGDGTVNDLMTRHPGRPIAVFPMGTENLVARHLKIRADANVVADVILNGHVTDFDTATVNGRPMILMASSGIDADIVHRLHTARRGHIRHWSYVVPIGQSLLRYSSPTIRVQDLDTGQTADGGFAIVSNFQEYGLNLKLAPNANPTDGQLDVCVFRSRSKIRTAWSLLTSLLWKPEGAQVIRFRSRHLRLSTGDKSDNVQNLHKTKVPLQVDGDPADFLPVDIRIVSGSLRLLVRQNVDE